MRWVIAALVFGTLLLGINVFRNRYLGKPQNINFLKSLSYILIIFSVVPAVLLNFHWFKDDTGYKMAAVAAAAMPWFVEKLWIALAERVIDVKKTETS